MKWITRERPKIDRIACPWLIKNFIDVDAEFYFVPDDKVKEKAAAIDAIPFDIPGVELSHAEDKCTFDALLLKYNLTEPALQIMAEIVRGADTDNHALTPQSAGLWAISAGLAFTFQDDYQLLQQGMIIYDALYNWAKFLQKEKHTQSPTEKLLLEVFHTYLRQKKEEKVPDWALQLKEIIQDQIDTNLSLNLKEISEGLALHPAYLSRQFSKYFDNLSFGEYVRKIRIEKAIELLETSDNSLAEIAYLTGFSDQSHFTRIFRKHTGKSPSQYKKNLQKGKTNPKG
jgi:AraC-like DNA-binding protein